VPNREACPSFVPVLIVGAGPTGLTLAAQLQAFGVEFRIIDRSPEAAHESRALAVQARTLEILQSLKLGESLASRGNPSAHLELHFERGRSARVELGGFAAKDTRFPFILFVSQAETEALIGDHLARAGITVERGVELAGMEPSDETVHCRLRANDREETLTAQYVVGCDGAHSSVRKQTGIAFEGDAYLQDFMLGDVDAEGSIEANALHSFASGGYVAVFFPLRSPAKWRVIAIGSGAGRALGRQSPAEASLSRDELSLHDLQLAVDGATSGTVRLREPVWLTRFRLHHRQARTYRSGRVFLAGDAAHIHSPVGAQGMNTGMQDAWNLGWKLALVVHGHAEPQLLDTYELERWPVGRNLLRFTDRLFSVFIRVMSKSPLSAWVRRTIVARVLPLVFSSPRLRAFAFRFVSELAISYRGRSSVVEGKPRLRSGPRAGDRLPNADVVRDGQKTELQACLEVAGFTLFLCGQLEPWSIVPVGRLTDTYAGLIEVRYLTRERRPDVLIDDSGDVLEALGSRAPGHAAQYLVRPDGYIAFRCAGRNIDALERFLSERALLRRSAE
jgi:2-polyprenyl-6-methoxyphenol hydroxylase-like FAD-dependent oxidoreductase